MNVSLTPELQKFVETQVASGRYQSASEVFREGLRLLKKQDQLALLMRWFGEGLTPAEEAELPPGTLDRARDYLRRKVQAGLDAIRRGDVHDGEQVFQELTDRLRAARESEEQLSKVER